MPYRDYDDEFFRNYIRVICYNKQSDLLRLYNVLSARGYLLDLVDHEVFISDNSHPEDKVYLNRLLLENNVGYIQDNELIINNWPLEEVLCQLLKTHGSTGFLGYFNEKDWNYFKYRIHGKKLLAFEQDPFIARLVKGISSVGIITFSSCDGHGRDFPYISFYQRYNLFWFRILFENLIQTSISLKSSWNINRYIVVINPKKDFQSTYLEMLQVANLLYDNRIALRKIKQKVVNQIKKEDIVYLDDKKAYELLKSKFLYEFLSNDASL